MSVPPAPANPERWFRTYPDSSMLARPRLLARSLIDVTALDEHISYYERLLGMPADLRMPIPDFGGLELAAVGNLLLIASARAFTPIQRHTSYSLIVPSLGAQLDLLGGTDTTVLEPSEPILPGARARVRYPDHTLAELVEHRPWLGEQPRPAIPGAARADLPATGVRLLARRAVDDEEFLDTVRLYETLLQAPAIAHPRLAGPVPAQTAIVGNLLLVGLSRPIRHNGPQPRVALIVSAPTPNASRPPWLADMLTGRTATSSGRPTSQCKPPAGAVVLAGNVTADVWNERCQSPHVPQSVQAEMGAEHD